MLAIEAHETQALRMEVELNLANRTVTVLGDDEIGDVLDFWIVWFVVTWAVNKADDVGVLLDGAGLAQVGQLRDWRRARLN